MRFAFSEEQEAIRALARRILETRATKEALEALERGDVRFDPELWKELAGASLLGIALPEEVGGSGCGFLELCILLAEVGRTVAPVPAWATLVLGADPIAAFGSDEQRRRWLPGVAGGSRRLSAALVERGSSDVARLATRATRDGTGAGAGWRLCGAKVLAPAAQLADAILIPAATDDGGAVFVVDASASGLRITPATTTSGEPFADVELDGVAVKGGDRIGAGRSGVECLRAMHTRALVGLCAMQVGVSERALQIAAQYTSQREQFGRPIGSFQAVQQRMADAFIDVEAIRWTTWHAAWCLAQGLPAEREAAIAKFWVAEAGARVAATTQQVHGGIGIDVTYPLFRYTLWAKQIELMLGSAAAQVAWLGSSYGKAG